MFQNYTEMLDEMLLQENGKNGSMVVLRGNTTTWAISGAFGINDK